VPRLIKIVFINFLAKLLGTELSTSMRERTRRNTEKYIKPQLLITNNKQKYHTAILTNANKKARERLVSKKILNTASNSICRHAQEVNSSKSLSMHVLNNSSSGPDVNHGSTRCMVRNDSGFMAYIDREDSFCENVFFELDGKQKRGFMATGEWVLN
jgi:hypothetical protein